ncbi:hypothetical protein HYW36_01380 [Candidatus Saccharibacteria bacterium]|nr:hypothetical protein [Candidatus Saccharibacteria bacterium]
MKFQRASNKEQRTTATVSPRTKALKVLSVLVQHIAFIGLLVVLMVYLLVVWRLSQLAGAEPDASQDVAAAAIPKVDKNAIDQIEALEKSNTQIKSFFNSARNNPFAE